MRKPDEIFLSFFLFFSFSFSFSFLLFFLFFCPPPFCRRDCKKLIGLIQIIAPGHGRYLHDDNDDLMTMMKMVAYISIALFSA